ncbi:hypothetical protein ES703_18111 [subsurface metagenome]
MGIGKFIWHELVVEVPDYTGGNPARGVTVRQVDQGADRKASHTISKQAEAYIRDALNHRIIYLGWRG